MARAHLWLRGQASTIDRDQEIDREGFDFQGPELQGELHDIAIFLAHADDSPRTDLQPGSADSAEGFQTVVISVSRANLGVEPAAGIEIVIDPVDTAG